MNPLEFLKNHLKEISVRFPEVHIKYGFNTDIQTHIVELLPLSEYYNNGNLMEAWIPLSVDFRANFPLEEISFISEDSTLSVSQPTFEFNKRPSYSNVIAEFYVELSESEIEYTFPTSFPIEAIATTCEIVEIMSYPKQTIIKNDSQDDYFYLSAA